MGTVLPGAQVFRAPQPRSKEHECGCRVVSWKIRMISVASKRKKTQFKVMGRVICSPGASVPFPVFPHPKTGFLRHRPCFPGEGWLQVQPSDQSLANFWSQQWSSPPANEAVAQRRGRVWWPQRDCVSHVLPTHHNQGWVLELFYMLPSFIPFSPQSNGHSPSVSIVSVATELFWVQPILSMFVSVYITLKSPLLLFSSVSTVHFMLK